MRNGDRDSNRPARRFPASVRPALEDALVVVALDVVEADLWRAVHVLRDAMSTLDEDRLAVGRLTDRERRQLHTIARAWRTVRRAVGDPDEAVRRIGGHAPFLDVDAWIRTGDELIDEIDSRERERTRRPAGKHASDTAPAVRAFIDDVVDVLVDAGEPLARTDHGSTSELLRLLCQVAAVPAPVDLKKILIRSARARPDRVRQRRRADRAFAEFFPR